MGSVAFLGCGRQLEAFCENGIVFWKLVELALALVAFSVRALGNRVSVEFGMLFGRNVALARARSNVFVSFSPSVGAGIEETCLKSKREAEFGFLWRLT